MKIFQRLFKIANGQRARQNKDKPKDIAKACFYRSIYLIKSKLFKKKVITTRKTHNQPHSQSIMKIKECQKSDSSQVLPLSVSPSSSDSSNEKKENKLKGDNKTKPMSRMKELLRRAAASTKSEKGEKLSQKVMNMKNCGALTEVSGDDRLSSNLESPRFSFSTIFSSSSSSISGISMASSLRKDETCNVIALNATLLHGLDRCSSMRGNWITTDSEFVVLELSG